MLDITITPVVVKAAALAPTCSLFTIKIGGHAEKAIELDVQWHPPQETPSLFALLSWHSRSSEFKGRDEQMAELKRWANGARAVSIRFVTGAGGVGKSRLAAEFASELQKEKWAAGFVDLKEPKIYESHSKNILIVIDYPEENQEGTRELLRKLGSLRPEGRLRVLFLTRQEMSAWQNVIRDIRVETLVEMKPVHLSGIDAAAARDIYLSASQSAGKGSTNEWLGVDEEMISAWLKEAPENKLPLFILAAGVHNARNPGLETIEYKGRDIVESLVERELARFRNIARDCNVKDGILFARLLSIATIAGVIPENKISEVIERLEPYGELPAHFDPQCELEKAGLLDQGEIRALKPDIIAAAFITRVLGLKMDIAPELAWIGLSMDVQRGLLHLGRLSYDAEVVLANHRFRLSNWLAEGIEGHIDRAQALISSIDNVPPMGLLNAVIAACKIILPKAENEIKRARICNILSLCLSNSGQRLEALEAGKRAVELYERLAAANPQAFEPYLATSLNNLGSSYSAQGQRLEGLEAAQRAVELYERLAAANPQAFEPGLAMSLNNLGKCYSELGQRLEALEAGKRAVELYERLAAANPQAFEPYLATSLNNLGNLYSELGQRREALEAAQRAVELYERLAAANPQAFEPDLASSLNSLGNLYSELGQRREALEAAQRAVEIGERLAAANPQAFEPDLAMSLNNLGKCYSELGQRREALEAAQRAVEIRERLAAANPKAFEPGLAMSLSNLGSFYSELGQRREALEAAQRAVEIGERLAAANPKAFEPGLAMSLSNLGSFYSAQGQRREALEAGKRAVEIYERLAAANPQAFEPAMARSYGTLGSSYRTFNEDKKSAEFFKNGILKLKRIFLEEPDGYKFLMAALVEDYVNSCKNLSTNPDALLLHEISKVLEAISKKI